MPIFLYLHIAHSCSFSFQCVCHPLQFHGTHLSNFSTSKDAPGSVFSQIPSSTYSPLPQPPFSHPNHPMITHSKNKIFKPKISIDIHLFSTNSSDPTTFAQDQKISSWWTVMCEEFDALLRNSTWDLVPAHLFHNAIGCKWVYKTKKE